MEFLKKEECVKWCLEHNISLKDDMPDDDIWEKKVVCKHPEKPERYFWFTQFIESYLGSWDECLLWATTWGVWPSSENMYLYYKLKESYKNMNTIEQNPGLLAIKKEKQDIISFLYLYILFGWDVFLFNNQATSKIKISHDEIVILSVNGNLEQTKKEIIESKLRLV